MHILALRSYETNQNDYICAWMRTESVQTKKENLCLKIPLFEEASHAKREEIKSGKQRM